MKTICDINQFVEVVLVLDETFIILSSYFMQHVLMKFGICHLVVINDSTVIKGYFFGIYQGLNLKYDMFSKDNYEGITVKHFHRFLNKSVTIAVEERGINDMFVPTIINVGCSWNSAHINGIYIYSEVS